MRFKKLLLSLEVFVIFLCLTLYTWYTVTSTDRQRQIQNTEVSANQLKNGIEAFVSERVSVLQQVRNFLLNGGNVRHEQFLSFCKEIIGQVPGFQAIEYENDQTKVVWSEPFLKTGLVGRSNEEPESLRQTILKKAIQDNTVKLTPSLEFAAGWKGFYVIVPVSRNGSYAGAIYGFFNTDTIFDLIFNSGLRDRYNCLILDGDDVVFSTEGTSESDLSRVPLRVEKNLEIRNQNWKLHLWPKEYRGEGGVVAIAVLVFGLALSTVLGSLVWVLSSKAELAEVYAAMLETSQTLSASNDLNTVLRTTGEACLRMTGINRCCIFLWDSGRNQFEPAWISANLESLHPKFMQFRPKYGESLLINKLVDEKRSLVLSKPESLASFSPSFVSKYQVKSLLVVPLVSKNNLVGAITLDQLGERHRFTSRDQVMIEGIANHAATAVESTRLFAETQKQSELIAQKNKELESLLSMVSQDLKGPLLAMEGMTQLLRENCGENLSENGRHCLHRIQANIDQMDQLIGNALEFSRIARGMGPAEKILVPELLNEVLTHLQVQKNGHEVQIINQNDVDEVWFSRDGLKQVFKNLIDNAIKFSCYQPDAQVVIGSKELDGETCFYVKDNGIGIDKAHHGTIFDLFHRLEELKGVEGTGVGLAIVKRVLETCGGRVWLESERGKGTTFFFSIPERDANS
jgi:signal transduction histidine kinase/sensor domain CHASE-containing protein